MTKLTIYSDKTHLVHEGSVEINYSNKEVVQSIDVTHMTPEQIESLAKVLENNIKS